MPSFWTVVCLTSALITPPHTLLESLQLYFTDSLQSHGSCQGPHQRPLAFGGSGNAAELRKLLSVRAHPRLTQLHLLSQQMCRPTSAATMWTLRRDPEPNTPKKSVAFSGSKSNRRTYSNLISWDDEVSEPFYLCDLWFLHLINGIIRPMRWSNMVICFILTGFITMCDA